ncbi:type II toxin-antitoxin system RelE family toxin [Flavisolibacter ginsenosidimutans]|uniref:Addiction module toxin RelE n=1 Tax=Flavisolibacter ginsenosidimutans TaxID=661481 RepID=A0A5B8UPD1_9BACT|nr:type II toxin-antitoxin system RelE/ParE family toxin [Flavisolibacter ginsenosidimutans]QEC58212.1 hypothetical protein FSB75_20655 [Flavisolibacter ginsenosidimutans]
MSYRVVLTPECERELKFLSKKHASFKNDLQTLINSLKENPVQGKPLGNNSYKIRLAITSKGKGKSGGGRVITHIFVQDEFVLLISIYDKSDQQTISDTEIKKRLESYLKNL